MEENSRTETARDHDDKDIIEGMIPGGEAVPSTGGGALARDLSSREALGQIDDPDGKIRATKQDDIDADQAYDSDRGPDRQ